ncbi:hypothetical protein EJV47_01790 [Hymenobacter gummosus]|uniref:Exo-alpha-sialidase n=1 Tax=Hymenobacter gummosus TaxID=1776032 RepID=A0A3S0HRI5_9BACT|nr:hypothetical protein [Hymenobacter gummosus]RTQ53496.1 hypothetical protein EJV47_01790 [Hymenobacter gummosus]
MMRYWILVLGVAVGACSQQQEQDKQKAPSVLSDKTDLRQRTRKADHAVHDLLPVSGDTLIAVKWHGGLAITTNAGQTWQHLHDQRDKPDFLYIKYLTIDHNYVLWGLDSWPGVHEPPYSRMAYSTDFGKTWIRREFNPRIFFPYKFYSCARQPVQIITYNGQIHHMGDAEGQKWKLVKAVPELNYSVNDTVFGDSYFDGARFKFLETGELFSRTSRDWKPIVTIKPISELNDVCACDGSIYLVGYNRSFSPTPHYLLQITNSQIKDTVLLPELEQLNLRCDNQGRLWAFDYRRVWIKAGNRLIRRY